MKDDRLEHDELSSAHEDDIDKQSVTSTNRSMYFLLFII